MAFADQRRPYSRGVLGDETKGVDPLQALAAWMQEARDGGDEESNVMALATVDPGGQPVVRYVLCKGVTDRGVRFFTNTESRKAESLAIDPRAAVTFWWPKLERSIRIVGATEPLPRDAVDAYFASRPRGSRLGAWTSQQSRPIEGREALDAQAAEIEGQFTEPEPLGAPPTWGGYELVAREIELWQGRDSRLHDRFRFTRPPLASAHPTPPGGDVSPIGQPAANAAWTVERLQP